MLMAPPSQSTESKTPVPGESQRAERDFFDEHVRSCGEFQPLADRAWRNLARRFLAWLNSGAGGPGGAARELLDVGCGTGASRRIYTACGCRYTGVDLSPEALSVARRRHPDSNWVVADACRLPFADEVFDVVAFSSVLHHIPDYESAVVEAARVVKPGGFLFAFDPNLLHPAMALLRHPRSPLYLSVGVSPNERPLLPTALRRAFRKAGLHDIHQRCQSDLPFRQVAPRAVNACLSVYNYVDRGWEMCGLGRWFGTFVVTAGHRPPRL